MRWMGWSLLLALLSSEAWAQACVVHSQGERLDVKVCQQNRNIPEKLFLLHVMVAWWMLCCEQQCRLHQLVLSKCTPRIAR